jgi:hypothetical protein
VKTKLDLPSNLFSYKPTQLASGMLDRVRKKGVGAIAPEKGLSQKGLSQAVAQSALKIQQQLSVKANTDNRVQSRVESQTARSAVQDGQTVKVLTKQAIQGETNQQQRSEVSQRSQQVVQGQTNGKPVYKNVEREVFQINVGNREAEFKEVRVNHDSSTRNVVQKANATRVSLSTDSSSTRNRSDTVAAQNRTETETYVRTYDSLGNLVSEKASRQAVTTTQQQQSAVKAQAEASRQVAQQTTVEASQEGKKSVRAGTTETTDTSKGHQQIETQIQSKTATLVENLGADGEVLSAKASAQQVTTTEARTIDTSRASHTEQTNLTRTGPDQLETTSHTQYDTRARTVDQIKTEGDTQQFDDKGALVREQAFERQVTTTSTENRNGESQTRAATSKEKNGDTVAETDITSSESVAAATRVVSEQGGAKTERVIESQLHTELRADLANRMEADGQRTISFDTQQTRTAQTADLTAGTNGQGRLVESETKIAQLARGQIEYSPETQQVGVHAGAGAIIVDIRSAAGLRASFKLDEGQLEFDFSAETATVSHQEVTTGKVIQGNDGASTVTGSSTDSQCASVETVHFHGHVNASVDAAGNRVLELDGELTQDSAAVLVANQQQGIQAERSYTELDVFGRLAVNRQVSTNGSATEFQTQAEAELTVARVEKREDAAVGMASLSRLTTADAVRAGFQAYRSTIQLHVGGFDLGISFVA